MNQEKQTFDPRITPKEKMQDFEAYADEVEAGAHDSKIIIEDKGDFPPYYEHPAGLKEGVSAATSFTTRNSLLDISKKKAEEADSKDYKRKLIAAGIGAFVGGVVSTQIAADRAEPTIKINAPDPTEQVGDVAITPEGHSIKVVDGNYADLDEDPSKVTVHVGGDTNQDGYIDDVDPSTPGNQAIIEQK